MKIAKKSILLFALLALVASYSAVTSSAEEGSWTGEVIDIPCYVAKGAKGQGHMECGSKCVKGGMPAGLLIEDTTYLLVSADHKPMNDRLAEHVSHQITVTGDKYESKGANVIIVKDFKAAK